MGWDDKVPFETLKSKTLSRIERIDDDELLFETDSGERFRMYHAQDCCESVSIESVAGNLDDLLGEPILLAEEATNEEWPEGTTKPDYCESHLWTFYKLATRKGYVDIRWLGESNGYYSEVVDFERV